MGKKSIFLVLLLLAVFALGEDVDECPNAPSVPQDRRTDRNTLKIATYNGEWLFLNGRTCPGTGCTWTTPEMAEQHLLRVVDVLANISADIVNVVEINDCNVLKQMAILLNNRGMNYHPYLLSGTDTATGQNVGLLTRIDPLVNLQRTDSRVAYPMEGNTCGTSSATGTTAVSKHYFTSFRLANMPKPLSIFGMHFLAFPIDAARCRQREAQASVIRNLVKGALEAGHSVAVLGDINDYDGNTLDLANSVPTSRTLSFLKDPLPDTPGNELFNTASLIIDQSKRYSSWYDKYSNCSRTNDSLTTIDHILLSNDLKPFVSDSYYAHAYPGGCVNTLDSDHWPVVVQLNFPHRAMPPMQDYDWHGRSPYSNESSSFFNSQVKIALVAFSGIFLIAGISFCFMVRRLYWQQPQNRTANLLESDSLVEDRLL